MSVHTVDPPVYAVDGTEVHRVAKGLHLTSLEAKQFCVLPPAAYCELKYGGKEERAKMANVPMTLELNRHERRKAQALKKRGER